MAQTAHSHVVGDGGVLGNITLPSPPDSFGWNYRIVPSVSSIGSLGQNQNNSVYVANGSFALPATSSVMDFYQVEITVWTALGTKSANAQGVYQI